MRCVVCDSRYEAEVMLANGNAVHSTCLDVLSSNYSRALIEAVKAKERLLETRKNLNKSSSMIGHIAALFGLNEGHDAVKSRMIIAEKEVNYADGRLSEIRVRASSVYDYLLTYPPDWEERRMAVHARDRVCKECGSSGNLHVHHVTPLGRGGNNKSGNLVLLCEACHQKAHGGRSFEDKSQNVSTRFADRVKTMRDAIASGKDVEFTYLKGSDGTSSRRKVTPEKLVEYKHGRDEGMTLCLEGYCHTRKAHRVFAIKRMSSVRLRHR